MKRAFAVVTVIAAALVQAASAESTTVLIRGFAPVFGNDTVLKQVGLKYDVPAPGDQQAAAALLSRINVAADVVCRVGPPSEILAAKVEKCRAGAVSQAVKDIGSSDLTAAAANAK